jgi:SAM-dependent methyltransferase
VTRMSDATRWHDDDAFWTTMRDAMFPPERFEDASEQVDAVLDLAGVDTAEGNRVTEGCDVLDLPCGPGRHALEFARRGCDVTGVDATSAFVEEARSRATAAEDVTGRVEFETGDMREYSEPDAFELAVNLYTSFGYFEDRADDECVARRFHENLRPGGTLVLQLACKEVMARDFQTRTWDEHSDGDQYVLEEHSVADDWSWMENEWTVVADGATESFDVSHRLYSAYELESLLEDVGFETVDAYGDLQGGAFDETADALVVVATK